MDLELQVETQHLWQVNLLAIGSKVVSELKEVGAEARAENQLDVLRSRTSSDNFINKYSSSHVWWLMSVIPHIGA